MRRDASVRPDVHCVSRFAASRMSMLPPQHARSQTRPKDNVHESKPADISGSTRKW
ncbi:hypothetical protein HBI56_158860 [Parastagonospora nodorum]|uniref:Uncharacterized protein n=1 Tax=Phaeosphaeria nodorum (strain SN15 / ATCC MYA-4574 / FGSC 10173) TaxID=321614 RepID=A0A7U2HUH8_PHANO|nr:hypothetical protein HBH56_189580 [Parastagonospora nodorum]QRC92340.1 hypothetical protein JI435_402300 [Parastagonospora nodorum SN15]KAH3925165.1 hypothetical protein HBH54_185390 [Parastagonospora nodorum]KAH3954286.1 hypothetical protein HBH53_024740 [Parastagonospora nodorum]KAH3963731.1 hypothetical protein HBH51_164580 [Parastagonospora nodorum]